MAGVAKISILGDASGAVNALGKAQGAVEKTHTSISKFGVAMGVFTGGLILDAAKALGGMFVGAISGAQEAARNMRVLQNQINNLGEDGKRAFADASDFADQFGASIGVDDDDIRAVQSKLASFPDAFKKGSLGAEAMHRAVQAAFDLQAIGIGEAQSNIIGIGKALNDPIKGMKALTKQGVSFTQEQQDQIKNYIAQGKLADAQRVLLAGIESNAKGAASAAANPIDKLRVGFQNLIEGIVGKMLPTFNKVADFITSKVLPKIQQLADWAGPKLAASMAAVGAFWSEHGPEVKKAFIDNIVTPIREFLDKHGNEIKNFFGDLWDRLKTVNIGKLKETAKNIVEIGGVFKVGASLTSHPVLTVLGLLAAKYPKETADVLNAATSALSGVIGFAAKNPDAVKNILLVLAAYKGLSAITGLKLPDLFSNAGAASKLQVGAGDVMLQAARLQDAAAAVMLRAAGMQDAGAVGGAIGGAGGAGIKAAAGSMMLRFSGYLLAAFNAVSFVKSIWNMIQHGFSSFDVVNVLTGGLLGNVTDTAAVLLKAFGMDPKTVDKLVGDFKDHMFGQMKTFFGTAIPNLISGWLTKGLDVHGGWSGIWENLKGIGSSIIDGTAAGIADKITGFKAEIGQKVGEIVDTFKKWLGISSPSTVFASIGQDIIRGLVNGIGSMFLMVTNAMSTVRSKIVSAVDGASMWLVQAGKNVILGFVNGVNGVLALVGSSVSGIRNRITSAVGDASGWLYSAGRSIIDGLRNGADGAWNAFKRWWNGVIDAIPGTALDGWKISSPSKVFADMGKNLMLGLVVGINDNVAKVDRAMSRVTSSVSGGFTVDARVPTLDAAVTAGAAPVVIYNTFEISPTADKREIGQAIHDALNEHLGSIGRPTL